MEALLACATATDDDSGAVAAALAAMATKDFSRDDFFVHSHFMRATRRLCLQLRVSRGTGGSGTGNGVSTRGAAAANGPLTPVGPSVPLSALVACVPMSIKQGGRSSPASLSPLPASFNGVEHHGHHRARHHGHSSGGDGDGGSGAVTDGSSGSVGLVVEGRVIHFPITAVGHCARMKVQLCNTADVAMQVSVKAVRAPFK